MAAIKEAYDSECKQGSDSAEAAASKLAPQRKLDGDEKKMKEHEAVKFESQKDQIVQNDDDDDGSGYVARDRHLMKQHAHDHFKCF
ncbi:hypothetical protein WN943_002261 [Citrus x changshan-huyou]